MLAALAAVSCSAPDASSARGWYDAHKATVGEVDRAVHAAVATIPDGPAAADAVRAVREAALPKLLALPGVLGLKVEWRRLKDTAWQPLGTVGLAPGGLMNGWVEAKSGVSYDDRMIGWGEYQTAYENACGKHGDGAGRPGFEAAWDGTEGDAAFRVDLFVLATDLLDDAWRAGLVCPAAVR